MRIYLKQPTSTQGQLDALLDSLQSSNTITASDVAAIQAKPIGAVGAKLAAVG